MPIGFGRVEFIKRSEGRNSCQLSSYLSRSRIFFEGNCALEPKLYDFSHRESVSYHEIILPEGADENLKVPEVLWNLAEKKEVRKDAQVSMHLVLALPDDKVITLEDRIELTRSFIQKHYPGLIAECVIHPPERTIEFTQENQALGIPKGTIGTVMEEKEGNYIVVLPKGIKANPFVEIGKNYPGMSVQEHNWHAHAQLTTRRLNENGKDFEDYKATDLMPVVKKGKVISGPDVGRLWADHQNAFFHSKGLALRVDDNGIVPQEHLGPVRMRGRAFALLEEHAKRLELNEKAASDPEQILNAITKRQSVFTRDDVERFILKHTPADKVPLVTKDFWEQEELVQLRDKESHQLVSKFTSQTVFQEERQILRLADRIYEKAPKAVPESVYNQFNANLSEEQARAYTNVLTGKGLSCIQGYAGVGKSYLLKALKDAYEERGLIVRAFGPDNATANVLKEKGFAHAENLYRFLYSHKHGLRDLHKGFEVWILDEAGKVGNKPLLELLKLAEAKGVKVILSGDSSQLPSVERGGAFEHFCKRYQAEILEEVQRQKDKISRSMAKDLAVGKAGEALDKLSSKGAIKWSLTKQDAMEALILDWAKDHRDTGKSGSKNALDSTVLVAHTNPEVRALNEMVRLVRKQRGEISEREFKCEVVSGDQDKATIYVSEGDRIEFRKKDSDLRVNNSDVGVLVRAEKNRFVVAVQENGKKARMVSFNPSEYRGFQLGYASTAQRVQGRTVDRAYVLHSPYLNKQMAYVKLTRHVDHVAYFVAKEDAAHLSDLKRQALRDGFKDATYRYTDSQEIEKLSAIKEREEKIQTLRSSEALGRRFKGAALHMLDRIKEKTHDLIEQQQDRSQGQEFFSFKGDVATSKGVVCEVSQDDPKKVSRPLEKASPKEVLEKIIAQDKENQKHQERFNIKNTAAEIEKDFYDNETSSPSRTQNSSSASTSWKDLPKEDRRLLSAYFTAASKASELRDVVQVESGDNLEKASSSPHYSAWQKACGARNESAYQLRPLLKSGKGKGVLKDKSLYYIEMHAKKHEDVLRLQEQRALQAEKVKDLDVQLNTHVDTLLYKLFPDGPSSKTAQSYRFGSKGSLLVTHSGSKAGQFYDFERQEGGGLLKLIARELKLEPQEARTWAGEFLGIANDIKIPANFQKPALSDAKESDWVSVKPDPKVPAPKFEEQGKLSHYYTEVMRHPYHDEQGNLLYYVTRLQDKNDPSRKITPPLSYGYFKESPEELSWQRRGYKEESGKKPLYNLHLLREKPLAPILIVEGEKTADRALEKMPDRGFICMTWSGGASSVSKADWSPLFGRKVVVWPDNDEAGFRAANDVCDELKKAGASKICMAERPELFAKLPEKWDLADPLPEGLKASSLSFRIFDNRKDRLQKVVFGKMGPKATTAEKLRAAHLLYYFEKRVEGEIQKELAQDLRLSEKDQVWRNYGAKTLGLLNRRDEIFKEISSDPRVSASGKLAERLAFQIQLFEAKNGHPPGSHQIVQMKGAILQCVKDPCFLKELSASQDIKDLAIDRSLEPICAKSLKGYEVSKDDRHLFECSARNEAVEISKQKELEIVQNQAIEKQQALEKSFSKGLSL